MAFEIKPTRKGGVTPGDGTYEINNLLAATDGSVGGTPYRDVLLDRLLVIDIDAIQLPASAARTNRMGSVALCLAP